MENKTVLITGGERGIGEQTAYKFAENKANVIITYIFDKEKANEVVEKCLELGAKDADCYYLDLSDNANIEEFSKKIKKDYGNIDILINNAGVAKWQTLLKHSVLDIENTIRVNLLGLILLTRGLLPIINEQIINIASGAGKTGYKDLTIYCAAKFGVRGFSEALAKEINNVKVVVVNPNTTATDLTDFKGRPPEEIADIIYKTVIEEINVEHGGEVDAWNY